jgi:hypothetical protein
VVQVIAFPQPNAFGDCPQCKRTSGYRDVMRLRWFFCTRHKVRWRAPLEVFAPWRDEQARRQSERWFVQYREVEPHYRGRPYLIRLARQASGA